MNHNRPDIPTRMIEELKKAIATVAHVHAENPTLDSAAVVLRMRKLLPHAERQLISLAVESYFSRKRATEKLGAWAKEGFFSSSLLEQASRHAISSHRAEFFRGLSHILEIGTGTGADTAALARVANKVTSIEIDPDRAQLARENLQLQGITNVTVLVGDITEVLSSLDTSSFDGLFADPARRTAGGARVKSSNDYSPPLEQITALEVGEVRAIKVSPGLFTTLPTPAWTRYFIGIGDECLEQTLLYGTEVPDSSVYLADEQHRWAPPLLPPPLPSAPSEISGYISEAHALINRSQYLSTFFAERNIAQLAPDIAYGTSLSAPAPTPFLDSFRIIEVLPFSPDRLKHALHSRGWTNRTELKKRNSSIDLDSLRASLDLPPHSHNGPFGTVFLCKWKGAQTAIITERHSE